MPDFRSYLNDKRAAVRATRERNAAAPPAPKRVTATVAAGDGSGVRRVTVRGHRLYLDSGHELGGFDLGPSPVEALLGVLGGCLAHTVMVQASLREIPLDSVEVEVSATIDGRAGLPAFPDVPFWPTDIAYVARIASPAGEAEIRRLLEAAERVCPVTALLTQPQPVTGSLVHVPSPDGHAARS